jgi:hypothetical protein
MSHPPSIDPEGFQTFAALDVGHTITSDGSRHPTVAIEAGDHPAVADLARVHAVEGIGDVCTVAMRSDDALVLGIVLSSPVTAAFAVVFSTEAHGPFLAEVADVGSLTIATTDPTAVDVEQPLWLAVDIDGAALRQVLG